jgi:hypothetical protein
MRLIDADKIPFSHSEDGCLCDVAYRYDINDIPTIDAVPVIYCKECVHFRLYGKAPFMYYACAREGAIRVTEEDDFCKHGERAPQ